MTIAKFIKELKKQKSRRWTVTFAALRCGNFSTCPIYAVAGLRGMSEPISAAKTIGLSMKSAKRIVDAADTVTREPILRARMLAAVGLAK